MFKIEDICRVINTIGGHKFEIGEIVTIVGGTDDCWKCENDNGEQWWLDNRELELVNTNKGVIDMIKAGDLVKVVDNFGTMWEVGTVGEVVRIIGDVAHVLNDNSPLKTEIFTLSQLELVKEEKDEKMAVLPKDLFKIGDRVVANCTSDSGNYRLGDTGTVVKFREAPKGDDVGVKFDNKKETITTWCYPENLVLEDEEDIAPEPVEYGMIKIFNLTSLRKRGWEFDNQGNLNLSGTEKSMSGLMLNIIDGEFMAYEDACEDNIYIVGENGIEYVIDKALKGKLFKKI